MDEIDQPDCGVSEFSQETLASARKRIQPPASVDTTLVIPTKLFHETLTELRRRSDGRRESAAVLCGRVSGLRWSAEIVRFHHHLCVDRGRPLSINLTEAAKYRLYDELNRIGLRMVAAIHTHPEDWVDLSWIDERNQLCSRLGFWSIVIPWYGRQPWHLSEMGIHIRSADGWARLTEDQAKTHVLIEEGQCSEPMKAE